MKEQLAEDWGHGVDASEAAETRVLDLQRLTESPTDFGLPLLQGEIRNKTVSGKSIGCNHNSSISFIICGR